MAWKVTIDNGSTFTDGCLLMEDRISSVKVLTTPYDLMSCFAEVFRSLARTAGLASENDLLSRVEEVRYSTTAGTNALLVRKGVRVGLITDARGADDVYGLRGTAPALIDTIVSDRVAGIEIPERLSQELDGVLLRAVRDLLNRGAQWIAVSLPEPRGAEVEREAKRRCMKLLPAHLLGAVPMLFSRELCADPDDERRTATVLLNSFLHRDLATFLYHADNWLKERHVSQPLRIMCNDQRCGRVAKTTAVKTLDSGPMGGLLGAAALSKHFEADRVITMDVGGTSTDIGLVENHNPVTDLFGRVHALPLSLSFPALRTAALGGGSNVRVRNEEIEIGPDSAGALPGPACFGRGGEEPTLTDAALLVGYLSTEGFAAGAVALQTDLAERAIVERIAKPLGLRDSVEGAWAILSTFCFRVGEEISGVLRLRSWKPEKAMMVSYGGCGPLVACMVADKVGIRDVLIPVHSASFSALGVAFSELAHEYRWLTAAAPKDGAWREAFETVRARGARDMFGEGASESDCAWSLRIRDADGTERRADRLEQVGPMVEHAGSGAVFDYRLSKRASARQNLPALTAGRTREALASSREIVLDGTRHRVPVVDADAVGPGETGNGPCLIQSPYWSAVLPSGWKWKLTEYGFRLSR